MEDVWELPATGGPDELSRLVAQIFSSSFPEGAPAAVRVLWDARMKVGEVLGWDGPDAGAGAKVTSLRDRLPADLPPAPTGPAFAPFVPLYSIEDEWAGELVNWTVHAVLHLGWVPDGSGAYRGRMAILVKPNGALGGAYMAAIKPFRYAVVYPAFLRRIEREWRAGTPSPHRGGHGSLPPLGE